MQKPDTGGGGAADLSMETTPEPDCVVPEGKSITALTVGELDYASRKMETDLITAIATPTSPHRMAALAWLAYLWTRRVRPTVDIKEFLAMEARDVQLVLGLQRARPAAPEEATDPTASSSGSSSPEPGESPTQTTS